jgi:lipopolysaccharide export system protein LptC
MQFSNADRVIRWYPVLLLVSLAGLTFWLDQKVQPPVMPRDGSTRHDPDVIMEKFNAMRMNPDGTQRYALQGKKLLHFPDNASTEMESPRFVRFDPKTAPVRVRSDHALISRNGDDVFFRGNVHVEREAFADQDAMSLQTEYLHLVPDQDLARTDKAITMIQGANIVKSVGMEMDNRARTLKLLSKVKVTYASPLSLPSPGRK